MGIHLATNLQRAHKALTGLILFLFVATTMAADDVGKLPAFPGAEGFGAESVGGRGGRILEVVNLDDTGPGSLRAAVEAEGRRIVVFRVAGMIELRSELVLTNPYITIAGQSAPGDGVMVKTHPSNPRSALTIKGGAHDGMPDLWEQEHQLDSNKTADGSSDADGDGYTNVEEYLHRTDPNRR